MAAIPTAARPARGMSLGELLADALRSPLAQAFALAATLGTLLFLVAPHAGWRDTFRGASLNFTPAPPFSLLDQHGQPVSLESLAGGSTVLTFIYTRCPDACPLTVAKLSRAQELLGDDAQGVHFVAVTVDPEHDGPAELRAYAERFKLDDRMRFLSGPADAVSQMVTDYHAEPLAAAALAQAAGAGHGAGHDEHQASPARPAGDLVHPSVVLLIDAEGIERFAYPPDFAPEDLVHDVQLMHRNIGGPSVPFQTE